MAILAASIFLLKETRLLVQYCGLGGLLEYTTVLRTARQVNPQNSFWREEIETFLDLFPAEHQMEATRQKYFGEF